ncbi:MAG: glycosyltransferase [Candidatus Omnitrophota bacterium]
MKKIKILRVIARLNIGGPAIHTVLLTEGLNRSGFQSLLVCGRVAKDEGDMSYYALDKEVKPVFIPELTRKLNLFNDITAFIKIYKIIRSQEPDIIHTHTAKAGTLGRLAAIFYNLRRFSRKRVIIIHTFHGHVFGGYFNKIQTRIFIFVEKLLARFTHKIITVSDSVREELMELGIAGEGKIEVIPLGFELDRFLKIPPKDNIGLNVGIVGRIVPIKNHRLFLEAVSGFMAVNKDIRARFKIIGDGELRGDLEERARKLGIDKYVELAGWQRDLPVIYSDLDIVALTSRNEGTPVSLIEAMASARAVVATDVGGVRDLLGQDTGREEGISYGFSIMERGIMVRPDDAKAFAAALGFVARDSALRKSMGEAARDFVKDGFSKERLIRDIEDLYTRILNLP